MVRTQIQLTDEQANILKKMANSRHSSIAELIRRAVDNLIKSNPELDIEERKIKAIKILGKFKSGKKDISTRHDLHLQEIFKK